MRKFHIDSESKPRHCCFRCSAITKHTDFESTPQSTTIILRVQAQRLCRGLTLIPTHTDSDASRSRTRKWSHQQHSQRFFFHAYPHQAHGLCRRFTVMPTARRDVVDSCTRCSVSKLSLHDLAMKRRHSARALAHP